MRCATTTSACRCPAEPSVVLLHGFLGDRRDLEPLRRSLAGFDCISVDLPGHGDSAWLGGADEDEVERALPALLATLDAACPARRLVLVGYSMGGRIALQLASLHPSRVVGVVVLCGSPGIEAEGARRDRAARDAALATRLRGMDAARFEAWLRDEWYRAPLWGALPSHASFEPMVRRRTDGIRPALRASALEAESVGSQPSLWRWVEAPPVPLSLCQQRAEVSPLASRQGSLRSTCCEDSVPGRQHAVRRGVLGMSVSVC